MERLVLCLAAARKDFVRRLRDPFALGLWVGIPLVIGSLIVLAMGGSKGPAPRARVFVVDRDDSFASHLLVQALSSERAGIIEALVLGESEARERLDDGDGSALLVIPSGFGAALLDERAMALELVTNPAQRILPGIVRSALEILCEGTFYLHRLLGDEVRAIADEAAQGGLAELRVAEASVRIRRDMERAGPFLFPPVIEVEFAVADDAPERPRRSLAGLYLPSMLLMSLMFMAEGLADDLWRERTLGVLRRVAVGPLGAAPVLAGKLLAGGALMFGVALAGLSLGALLLDVAWTRVAPGAAWAAFAGTILLALMSALKLFAGSQRAAGLIGNLLLFPLIMVGGSMIPFEAMPEWLGRVGRRTPNGAAMEVLKQLLYGEPALAELLVPTLPLAGGGVALIVLSAWRLRTFARA